MDDALLIHRLHFSFTITYHYLFPQLTMGLALLIVVLKSMALWKDGEPKGEQYGQAARFWAKIFGVNFVFGVVTGIPMEFQFGTNWAKFSTFAGGVIGQTLAMEGMFAFFLESAFLGLFLFGEKRLSKRAHWFAALMVFVGSWLSGFFIIATNAWMQHPVGYGAAADGSVHVNDFWALLFNSWVFWQYVHNMGGAVVTGAFAMAALGAYYALTRKDVDYGMLFLRVGVVVALIASFWQLFPSGDGQGQNIARYQPVTLAAMEGLYRTEQNTPLVIIGQPNTAERKLDNPITIPGALGFLTYKRWGAVVKGLESFPQDQWPDNIPLLYYSYHIMVGLGTIFIAVTFVAAFLLWRGRLTQSRWMLWILMLSFPFPFIANTAGWMTAELGRQPWLVFGLFRTAHGASTHVSAGNGLFTLLGFMGMYTALSMLYLFLMWREIDHGPRRSEDHSGHNTAPETESSLTAGD
jgi:cytochrome d ubiquinol oxidase subunit I